MERESIDRDGYRDQIVGVSLLSKTHPQFMVAHITGNNLIPISVPIHFVDGSYMCIIL